MLICSFSVKSRRLIRDVCNTVATQSGLTDTESWARTGNTHSRVFATSSLISSKRDQKLSERMLSFIFVFFKKKKKKIYFPGVFASVAL